MVCSVDVLEGLSVWLLIKMSPHFPFGQMPVFVGVPGSSAALEVDLVGAQANDVFDADLQ